MTTGLPNETWVTGANGFLGRWLLRELTARGTRVRALLRRHEARRAELAAWIDARGGDSTLLTTGAFDLMAPDLGLDAETLQALDRVEAVFHLAARFDFGLDRATAERANVDAPEDLLRVVAGRPALKRFVHISGYRTEGAPARALDVDDPAALARFYAHHGAYETSKMQAHDRMARAAEALGVPLTRVSPAVVIGDSQTGETTQIVGIAETVRDLARGKLPALPGSEATWLPVIGVDVVARVLAAVPDDDASVNGHLVVFDDRTPSLPTLLAWCAERLGVSVPRWRVPVGVLRALPRWLSGIEPEALSFISDDRYDPAPFAAFRKRVGLELPDVRQNVERWVDGLLASGFGERPSDGANRTVAGTRTFVRGAGTTVLLHGLFLDGRTWTSPYDVLDPLVPDLPGLGRSGPLHGAPEAWMRALLAEVDEPVELVAQSLGTAFALPFAHAHPERVRRLVLVSPFFLQRRVGWWMRQPTLFATALGLAGHGRLTQVLEGPPDPLREAMLRQAVVRRSETARWLSWASRPEVRDRLARQLAELRVPVTLLVGERDPLRVAAPTNADVVIVEGAGHQLQLTHPAAVLEHLAQSDPMHRTA